MSEEVNVKLPDGTICLAKPAKGGWMGPTPERPYPDFEVIPNVAAMSNSAFGPTPYSEPPQHERISREEMFMSIAKVVAQRSTCLRAHVGAVLVVDGRVVSMGYNGSPPGMPHCLDVGCAMLGGAELGCQRTVHAEANCVAYAARRGISARDATLYTTHSPCRVCSMLLASAGVKRIRYHAKYRATDWSLLNDLGIACYDDA